MPATQDTHRPGSGGDSLIRRLLIRPGALGDFVVSIPALEALAPTEIWCPAENVPLAALLAPQARAISSTGLDLLELGLAPSALLGRLRTFDEIVSWYGSSRPEFRDAVGDLPFRFFPALPSHCHAVDFYLAQAGAPPGAIPRLPIEPRRRRGFVAIHPFSGSIAKNWPVGRFQQVAALLPWPAEWSAGPEEPLAEARRFESRLDLAHWLAEARVYLGNDSGVSHLAAAVGTPAVALFGPSDPNVWAPRGDRVTILDQRAASVESIVQACLGLSSGQR